MLLLNRGIPSPVVLIVSIIYFFILYFYFFIHSGLHCVELNPESSSLS